MPAMTYEWFHAVAALVTLAALGAGGLVMAAEGTSASGPSLPVVTFEGDVVISEPTVWADSHYRVGGNLVLRPGGTLTVRDSVIEILNTYSRQYAVRWEGGALVTDRVTLGGTKDAVGIRQSNLEMTDGRWDATDTTVRYCYGITFDHTGQRQGVLRATRLMRGENSDSVIMNGNADVILTDSDYCVSLTMDASKGGQGRFNLPVNQPLDAVYDGSNVPGAAYRLELVNTQVPLWFLFVRQVSMAGPATTVVLEDCPRFIPSIMGGDLRGRVNLPCLWGEVFEQDVTIGNVTFRAPKPVGIGCWGVYLWGKDTDLTLTGPTNICELMLRDGKATLEGSMPPARDARCSLTTVEVGSRGEQESQAELTLRHAELGRRDGFRGQLAAHKGGRIAIEDSLIQNADVIANPRSDIQIKSSELVNCELLQRGGQIQTQDVTSRPASQPAGESRSRTARRG